MKRYWHAWLTMVAIATMVTSVSAQSGSRYAPEIGSYQSILSRAGYGTPAHGGDFGGANAVQHSAPAYGQVTQGCGTPSGCGGAPVYGQGQGMVSNGPAYGNAQAAPMTTSPLPAAPMNTAPMNAVPNGQVVQGYGGHVDQGMSNGYVDGGYANYASAGCGGPSYAAPAYDAPVYSPGRSIGGLGAIAGRGAGNGSNLVVGASALAFVRDYEDSRLIARNPAGDRLYTNQADHETIGGVDLSVASRKQNGNGWEARYFGLFPDTADATLTGAQVSAVGLRGFDRLNYGGATLDTYYLNGTSQTVTRDTDINNLEFNLLRNGGRYCTRRGKSGNFELLGGFRYFRFDERFRYSTADGTDPLDYDLAADNTLLGLQLGTRSEICLGRRLRLAGMTKVGLFNNFVQTQQSITDAAGVYATVAGTGRDFNYGDEKNDIAMLGELDLGLIYQLSCNSRLRFGYKAIGVAGVALATDQIPYEFDNVDVLQSANTNGDLLLHGAYIGTEFCF